MSFIKKSSWSLASVLVRSAGSLLTNKLFALYFGAAGVGLLAHFQNLIGMLTQIPNDGINRGVMKFLADDTLEVEEKQRFLASGLILNMILFVLVALLLISMDEFFFSDFIFHLSTTAFYGLFFLAAFLFLLNLYFQSVVLAGRHIRAYALYSMAGVAVMLGGLYTVLGNWKLDYALFAFFFGQSASLLFFAGYVLHKGYVKRKGFSVSKKSIAGLSQFVLMAGSILVFGKLVDFLVRQWMINIYGLNEVGQWQTVVKVSDLYTMLFIATVGAVFYPQLASLIHKPLQMKQYVWKVFRLIGPATALGLLIVFMIKDDLLFLLFSEELISAVVYMPYQLIGDWFLLMAFLLTYVLSARSKTVEFILAQAFSACLYLLFITILMEEFSLSALPMAHSIRSVGYLALLVLLNRKILFA